jgi:predicted DNA-binding WGR domain protein
METVAVGTDDKRLKAVHLERRDAARNMDRFYRVWITPTLFGEWAVVSQWGRIGTHGRAREDWVPSLPEAQAVQARRVARKRRRGYC